MARFPVCDRHQNTFRHARFSPGIPEVEASLARRNGWAEEMVRPLLRGQTSRVRRRFGKRVIEGFSGHVEQLLRGHGSDPRNRREFISIPGEHILNGVDPVAFKPFAKPISQHFELFQRDQLAVVDAAGSGAHLWQLLFFVPAYASPVTVIYPMTHWLAMMLLGWAFGRWLLKRPAGEAGSIEAEGLLLLSGLSGLALFGVLRRMNLYGNMALPRDDGSLIQWLHVSKYPPALTFVCLELGLMALFLMYFMRRERRLGRPPHAWNPLLVFGQTALFFYILHFILLGGAAHAITGGMMLRGLAEAWIAAIVVLIVLYPICIGFRALKRRYPDGVLQYI